MDTNSLAPYVGRDLKKAVASLTVKSGKTKDGNDYYSLDLGFINNYHYRIFLKEAERFAVIDAINQIDVEKQLNF